MIESTQGGKMSFSELKVDELRKACDFFGVDVEPKAAKKDLLLELQNNGVDWSSYQKFVVGEDTTEVQKEVAKTVEPKAKLNDSVDKYTNNMVLVKLSGKNASFEVMGFKFTQANPYNLMSGDNAQKIMDWHPGVFAIATPREVQQFYS